MISTVLTATLPKIVSAQVTEEWVARYDGPDKGNDVPWDIVADSLGNVYVTGESAGIWNEDYTTVAYDSSGSKLWEARYHGPGDGTDVAYANAIDASRNVYVTGYSEGLGMGMDYATVKYDSSGKELWAARYDDPDSEGEVAKAIAVDPSGNVYVTGISEGHNNNWDLATVAYDSSGNELWVAKYNGPGNARDEACEIGVGPSGKIFVAGTTFGNGTSRDYTTIAYDSSGNELWVARYDGLGPEGPGLEEVRSMDIDSTENVYVTGWSSPWGEGRDYATVAYDSSGNELWVARYDGGGADNQDEAYDLVSTPSGRVYVTGASVGDTDFDCVTIAYDSSGNELWVARYNGAASKSDIGRAIATDSSDNVYVTGQSWGNGTSHDYITIAYDSSGNELWVMRYDAPSSSGDVSHDIVLDPLRNVYVTGRSWSDESGDDWVTIRYSQDWVPEPTMDINPDTLNLKSRGRWITAYIEMAGVGDVKEIDAGNILLNDAIPAESWPTAIGDYDEDGIPDLMVKFNRSRVQEYIEGLNLSPGGAGIFGYHVTLTITGSFNDGTKFECSDTIRVLVVERMGVELSPFLVAEYEGSMNGGLVVVQPQMSFPLSSHSSEHLVTVVGDIEYRKSPTRRMNYILTMRE